MESRKIKINSQGGKVVYEVVKRSGSGYTIEKVFSTRREAKKYIEGRYEEH